MATIDSSQPTMRSKAGVRRAKRHNLKIDMTPMVDLGFLLIAFFVMTAELMEPKALDLNMPKKGPETKVEMSNALTVLLDKNNTIYFYHGEWKDAFTRKEIFSTSFAPKTGLGKIIRDKQQHLDKIKISAEGRDGLMLLIKPGTESNYENVIDALDEALINGVKKYAIVDLTSDEIDYMKKQTLQ